jgi:hypothetical protein
MKKAILSILFVAGFIVCASYHWLAMLAYWIILLASMIFWLDIDAWQEKKRKKAMLLAVGNFIIDQYLEDPDDYSLYSFKAVEDWFDDCILGEEDGLYRVIDNCAYGDFDMRLVADSINDLIKHGILKVVYNGGFKIGYID